MNYIQVLSDLTYYKTEIHTYMVLSNFIDDYHHILATVTSNYRPLKAFDISVACFKGEDGSLNIESSGVGVMVTETARKINLNTWADTLGLPRERILTGISYVMSEVNKTPSIKNKLNRYINMDISSRSSTKLIILVEGMRCYWGGRMAG